MVEIDDVYVDVDDGESLFFSGGSLVFMLLGQVAE